MTQKQTDNSSPACVVIAIGLSLLPVGMDSWGGGTGSETFGMWCHLFVGGVTLIVCLISRYKLPGIYKNLNILVGLFAGYVLSAIFTLAGIAPMIDFSGITTTIEQVGFSAFRNWSSSPVTNRFSIWAHFLQLPLYTLCLLPRLPVRLLRSAKERSDGTSKWKSSRVLLR